MEAFLNWFFAFITTMFSGIWQGIKSLFLGIVHIFDFGTYFDLFSQFQSDFGPIGWILAILSFILVYAFWLGLLVLFVLLIRKCRPHHWRRFGKRADYQRVLRGGMGRTSGCILWKAGFFRLGSFPRLRIRAYRAHTSDCQAGLAAYAWKGLGTAGRTEDLFRIYFLPLRNFEYICDPL